jgi:hypothetical protein
MLADMSELQPRQPRNPIELIKCGIVPQGLLARGVHYIHCPTEAEEAAGYWRRSSFAQDGNSAVWGCMLPAIKNGRPDTVTLLARGTSEGPDLSATTAFDAEEWNAFLLGVRNDEF